MTSPPSGPTWVPNGLSLLRLALGLAFPFLPPTWRLPAVVVAALSDAADGAASRLLHADSVLGRLLDPIADKVFAAGVLLTFLFEGTLTPVEVLLVGLRDVLVGLGGAGLLLFRGRAALPHLEPTWLGKATTVAQLLFLLAVLTLGYAGLPFLLLAAGLGVLATLDYLRRFLRGHHQAH
jgi:phosphatidylglycerophosphate synthase